MPNIAFVNGKWSPLASAKVSVEDRGFQFGDGIYELIRTYNRKTFHLQEHLTRLRQSAKEIEIPLPYTPARLQKIIESGCRRAGYADTKIYIQVTRGAAPRVHSFPKKIKPTLVMTFREFLPLSERLRQEGVSILSTPDIRWGRCNIKSLTLLPNVLAREQALRSGAFEAIFIRDGRVTEGAGSNIFAVFGKRAVTPPAGPAILSGVTREAVLQIGRKSGLDMMERELKLEELFSADEIFLTGTTVEVLPVIRLDGREIGSGRPGKTTMTLYQAFQGHIEKGG